MGNQASHHRYKSALSDALSRGDLREATTIVETHPEFFTSRLDRETGNTTIHVAVQLRRHAILRQLLSYAEQANGNAELKQAAAKSIDYGRSSDGATPLMLACSIGDVDAVRILLQAGASPWKQDHGYHRTCLHYAAVHNHAAVVHPVVERSRAVPQYHPSATLLGRIGSAMLEDNLNRWASRLKCAELRGVSYEDGNEPRGRA